MEELASKGNIKNFIKAISQEPKPSEDFGRHGYKLTPEKIAHLESLAREHRVVIFVQEFAGFSNYRFVSSNVCEVFSLPENTEVGDGDVSREMGIGVYRDLRRFEIASQTRSYSACYPIELPNGENRQIHEESRLCEDYQHERNLLIGILAPLYLDEYSNSPEVRRIVNQTAQRILLADKIKHLIEKEIQSEDFDWLLDKYREKMHEFRTLVEKSQHAILIIRDWKTLYANEAFLRLIGGRKGKSTLDGDIREHIADHELSRIVEYEETWRDSGDAPDHFHCDLKHSAGHSVSVEVFVRHISWKERRARMIFLIQSRPAGEVMEKSGIPANPYQHLVENNRGFVFSHSIDGKLLTVNQASADALGYKKVECINCHVKDFLAKKDRRKYFSYIDQLVNHGQAEGLVHLVTENGEEIIWSYCNSYCEIPGHDPMIIGHALDVTARERRTVEQRSSGKKFIEMYNNLPDIHISVSPVGEVMSINHYGANYLGYRKEELIGTELRYLIDAEDTNKVWENILKSAINQNSNHEQEFRLKRRDNHSIWVHSRITLSSIDDNDDMELSLLCRDITQAQLQSAKLNYQAKYDALTGLLNRHEFEKHLEELRGNRRKKQDPDVFGFVDLDNFKLINDRHGHLAGDKLLRAISDTLSTVIRESDVLARIGGDEFGLLLRNCTIEQAKPVIGSIIARMQDIRQQAEYAPNGPGISIGLVQIDNQSNWTFENLLEAGDKACYEAKFHGGNQFAIAAEQQDQHQGSDLLVFFNNLFDKHDLRHVLVPVRKNDFQMPMVYQLLTHLNGEEAVVEDFKFKLRQRGLQAEFDQWKMSQLLRQKPAERWQSILVELTEESVENDNCFEWILAALGRFNNVADSLTLLFDWQTLGNLSEGFASRLTQLRECGYRLGWFNCSSDLRLFASAKEIGAATIAISAAQLHVIRDESLRYKILQNLAEYCKMFDLQMVYVRNLPQSPLQATLLSADDFMMTENRRISNM